MVKQVVPPNFTAYETGSPFIQHIGPLYASQDERGFVLGLLVAKHHCNTAGRLHGAMICAVADIALGRNIGWDIYSRRSSAEKETIDQHGVSMVTTNLSADFVGTARVGPWVETEVDVQRTGKTLGFANAYLVAGEERIARASGVFSSRG